MSPTTRPPTLLAAVLQGKLGIVKHHEDFTTAMVFGVLQWLPRAVGLAPILRLAGIDETLLESIVRFRVELWPWWDHAPNGQGAEPDVVITLTDATHREHIVVIEAKRGSGLGHNQLLRQADNVTVLARDRGARVVALVFLTEHIGQSPEVMGIGSVSGIPLKSLSWRDLGPVLTQATTVPDLHPMVRAMTSDVAAVLERWKLTRFQGLPRVRPVHGWSFPPPPKGNS